MNQNIEIEYKNLLTESEYAGLYKTLNFAEDNSFVQENIYFDTNDFSLKQKRLALRIRIKDQQAEMTLKSPHKGHLLETNHMLQLDEARTLIKNRTLKPEGKIAEVLTSYDIDLTSPIQVFAQLKTERVEKAVKNSLIVLDKSWYADQVDYELEVESSTAAEGTELFEQLLKELHIPKRETPNKIARAFAALNIEY